MDIMPEQTNYSSPFNPRISSESVLTPRLRSAQFRWLQLIADRCIYEHFDNDFTTGASVEMVLLASALANTRCPSALSAITGFYLEFVQTIVKMMNTAGLWDNEIYYALKKIATKRRPRKTILTQALSNLSDLLFSSHSADDLVIWLEIARGHLTCHGLQPYLDQVLVEEECYSAEDSIFSRTYLELEVGSQLDRVRSQIGEFLVANPDQHESDGDDAATTYGCVGLVLLALALTGSKSPLEIAAVSGFLREFPDIVIHHMNERNFWTSDWYEDLVATTSATEASSADWKGSLESGLESFYMKAFDHDPHNELELARSRLLWGGFSQTYVDDTYYEEFVMNGGVYANQ